MKFIIYLILTAICFTLSIKIIKAIIDDCKNDNVDFYDLLGGILFFLIFILIPGIYYFIKLCQIIRFTS